MPLKYIISLLTLVWGGWFVSLPIVGIFHIMSIHIDYEYVWLAGVVIFVLSMKFYYSYIKVR